MRPEFLTLLIPTSGERRVRHPRLHWGILLALLALWPSAGQAHDASAWGGLFRSRDQGATWFPANQGRPVGGALAIAVSPTDPNVLLLGTEAGLLASRNGGLDWEQVAPDALIGPVLAVAFDPGGGRALAATPHGVFRSPDGLSWQPVPTPPGANPARAIVPGLAAGRAYLLGWQRLVRTDDGGATWQTVDAGLPEATATALAVGPDGLFVVVGGEVWASSDEGRSWQPRQAGLPAGSIQTLSMDPLSSSILWAGGADRVFRSADRGRTWQAVGQPLADHGTEIRGLAADATGSQLVLSTHRGLYASHDGGGSWSLLVDNLPGHLEAGPLVHDPSQPTTLYTGFSLTPYTEQWARAVDGRSAASLLGLTDVAGAAAFFALLGVCAGWALHWLARRRAMLLREPRTS